MSQADSAKLYWGDYGTRMGWWLKTPAGKMFEVHGPSICVTSGGGPLAALEKVRKNVGWAGPVTIECPRHDEVDTAIVCQKCAALIFSADSA